jgi:eukaryotic-like serine/threonine-protein kinase
MSESQRYQIIERIASGGMAEVYRGESAGIEGFRKKVAIKRVLPKLSQNREFINMFLDEARLGAYLNHSRCVQVFDIGQGGGSHFIVMEYVDGADLKHVLEFLAEHGQLMRVEVACAIALGIAEGLAYAHQARDFADRPLEIVHRDISPQNVLMTRFGEVKLVDFGLAKASSHLTEEDEDIVKGKFGYLAPEITHGRPADRRVDIFAAGILLWEMLAGRRLFLGNTDLETFQLVRAAQVPDPRHIRKDVPDDVVRVLARALAPEPASRYSTADEFARDLSVVLMRLERPATYLDIADVVRATADERARLRQDNRESTAGIIGDLIIETLHDFSGVLGADEPEAAPLAARGAPETFEDPSQWGLDSLFEEPVVAPRMASPPQALRGAAPPPPPRARVQTSPARARVQTAPPKKEGPFWRRWFGG